uniref:Uncharacterized protein n=1 Tax=Anguilla anguilla TaxID=7936 RepID=A0A0E9R764_ANGAN
MGIWAMKWAFLQPDKRFNLVWMQVILLYSPFHTVHWHVVGNSHWEESDIQLTLPPLRLA